MLDELTSYETAIHHSQQTADIYLIEHRRICTKSLIGNTKKLFLGRGGGEVVSVLAFYSDDPSSNPAKVYKFSVKLLLKRTKINKKEAGVDPFFKKETFSEECTNGSALGLEQDKFRLACFDGKTFNFAVAVCAVLKLVPVSLST